MHCHDMHRPAERAQTKMGETEAGTHVLFPSAPTSRKPPPASVFVFGAQTKRHRTQPGMRKTEAGTHRLFPSAPTSRKPPPVSVLVFGALSAPKKCNSPLKSCLGAPRAPKSSSASMSAETSLKPCAAERVGRITACPAVGAPHKPPRVMRRSEQALCISWAGRTRPRGRAAHARRRGTHAFGGVRGSTIESDLWRTRAGSVSAWKAVRRSPPARSSCPASCSCGARKDGGRKRKLASRSGGDTYAAVYAIPGHDV